MGPSGLRGVRALVLCCACVDAASGFAQEASAPASVVEEDQPALDVPLEARDLDRHLSVRPQLLKSAKMLERMDSHARKHARTWRFHQLNLKVGAVALRPGLRWLEAPVRRLVLWSLKGQRNVESSKEIIPPAARRRVTTASLARQAKKDPQDGILVVEVDGMTEGRALGLTLVLMSPQGEEWERVDVTGALLVRTEEEYRQYVRTAFPVAKEMVPHLTFQPAGVPAEFLLEDLPNEAAVCLTLSMEAPSPELAARSQEARDAFMAGLQQSKSKHTFQWLPEASTSSAGDAAKAVAAAGCGGWLDARVVPGADPLVTDTEFQTRLPSGTVLHWGNTQRFAASVFGQPGTGAMKRFEKTAVKLEVAGLTTTYVQRNTGATSSSREDVVALRDHKGDVLDGTGLLLVHPLDPDLASQATRAGVVSRILDLETVAGWVGVLGAPAMVAFTGALSGVAVVLFGALQVASSPGATGVVTMFYGVAWMFIAAAVGAFATFILFSGPYAVACGMVSSATSMFGHSFTNKETARLGVEHNLRLARELGVDPLEAGRDYFPYMDDLAIPERR